MSKVTTSPFYGTLQTAPFNWIPLQLQLRRQTTIPYDPAKDPPVTVAQLNGDGTLYVDWAGVEEMVSIVPLVRGGQCEIAHLMLALRGGNFADAPRDCWWPTAAPIEAVKADAR